MSYTDTDMLLKFKQQTCMNRQLTIQRHCIPNKRKEKTHTQQLQTKDGPINKRSFENIKITLG